MKLIKLGELEKLSTAALRERYREVIGLEVRTNNRAYLLRRIAYALQQRAEASGELMSEPAAPPAPPPKPAADDGLDPRIPAPGTILERHYKDVVVKVKVLANGFEYEGRRYRSLSAIAREVTGTIWNGLLFFNLVRRKASR